MAEKDDADLNEDREEGSSENDLDALADTKVGGDGVAAGEGEEDEATIGEEYDLDVDNLDFGDNFEDDDEGEGGNKKIIIIAAAVVGLVVLGTGGWFLFSDGDKKSASSDSSGTARVMLDLPPKGSSRSMFAPPLSNNKAGGPLKAVPGVVATAGIVVPAFTMAAFAQLPNVPMSQPIRDQVDPVLIEQAKTGPLPIIGPKGRKSWKVYARAFDGKDARPRIAIIITGMGLSRSATEAAVTRLPGPVTLAFTPYAQALDDWAAIARRSGHEVLLSLPMESATFPVEDPGPLALHSEVPLKENLLRLSKVLSQMGGYVGVITHMGSLLSKDSEKLKPILETLKSRGLMFVDNGATTKTLAPKLATSDG